MSLFPIKNSKTELVTDRDYDQFFTKIVTTYNPKDFTELQEKVAELSNNNQMVLDHYTTWTRHLTLDTNRIKELFIKK